jgi:hypothetical protein
MHMQKGLKIDGQMRALAIALGGAILTSVIAMFVPVSVFESITGATGFSELVPATGAPLGDTARAMIAFGFGALAFAVLAAYLLRKPAAPKAAKAPVATAEPAAADIGDTPSFMEKMRAKIGDYVESRRNADAVTELSDLPKLRAGDAHPDAPPRRPISAHRDFGEVASETPDLPDLPDLDVSAMTVAVVLAEQENATLDANDVEHPIADPVLAETASDPTSVSGMVDRLELAVEERQGQIAKLEALAIAEIAKPKVLAPTAAAVSEPVIVVEPPRQTILEAVPSQPAKDLAEDDMDAALRSALETLHRMNARTR